MAPTCPRGVDLGQGASGGGVSSGVWIYFEGRVDRMCWVSVSVREGEGSGRTLSVSP